MQAGKHFDTSQGSDRANGWHYANSSDGITWSKPPLGIFDLSTCTQCSQKARDSGTQNNMLMVGDGMGIYRDDVETNASRRFKVKYSTVLFHSFIYFLKKKIHGETCFHLMSTHPNDFR